MTASTAEPKFAIEFTLREITILQQLLHAAVQYRGLVVAEPALMINRKLQAVIESVSPPQDRAGNGTANLMGEEDR